MFYKKTSVSFERRLCGGKCYGNEIRIKYRTLYTISDYLMFVRGFPKLKCLIGLSLGFVCAAKGVRNDSLIVPSWTSRDTHTLSDPHWW